MDKVCNILDQEVDMTVMEALRQRKWLEEDDESKDEEILSMSGFSFVDEWLNWQGIIGWTADILSVIRMAYGIDFSDDVFDEPINRTVEEW